MNPVAEVTLLETALAYAGQGFRVFPLGPRNNVPHVGMPDHGHEALPTRSDPQRRMVWRQRAVDRVDEVRLHALEVDRVA
jgi:hypothetical protein